MRNKNKNSNGLPWHIVESGIQKEIQWLKESIISPFRFETKGESGTINCLDCIYRKIAILIVSGEIKVTDFPNLRWGVSDHNEPRSRHGKEWHQKMMDVVGNYFTQQGFNVVQEPFLNYGRADLGIFKSGKKSLFIEIGATSPYKLLINLETMRNAIFLIVPEENRAIEFILKSI